MDTSPPDPRPFVIALVGFVIVAVLAYVFLRNDDPGRLVEPDRIEVVGDATVRLTTTDLRTELARVSQVGYALGDDVIYVEMVIQDDECEPDGDCGGIPDLLEVDLVLPESIGDRDVRAGTGRALVDCEATTADVPVCR